MFFQSLLPRAEIGANSYLLDLAGTRIVLDEQSPKAVGVESLPDFGPLGFDKLDSIIVSHAHHNHIGALPVLQRQCPSAEVVMTEATAALSEAMLHNSVNVMSSQREDWGSRSFPFSRIESWMRSAASGGPTRRDGRSRSAKAAPPPSFSMPGTSSVRWACSCGRTTGPFSTPAT